MKERFGTTSIAVECYNDFLVGKNIPIVRKPNSKKSVVTDGDYPAAFFGYILKNISVSFAAMVAVTESVMCPYPSVARIKRRCRDILLSSSYIMAPKGAVYRTNIHEKTYRDNTTCKAK
jgi:hypothetical protein